MYCRPPLVKSMSRSSIGGQSQYSGAADEEDDRTSSAATAAPAQPRRDSESMLAY